MTSQLLIIGIAVGVMLFLLSMIVVSYDNKQRNIYENIYEQKSTIQGLAEQPMLETESIYKTVARQSG